MPRRANPLSAAKVKTAKPGRYCDGAATGLYLVVRDPERKYFVFRYTLPGCRMREMGLGAAVGPSAVTLADARVKARRLHDAVRDRRDPLDERDLARACQRADAEIAKARKMTFDDCAAAYIRTHRSGWRNAKHTAQWQNTLETYVTPVFGALPVETIDTGLVMKVLEPLWATKTETASRLRGRIESVLDWATARSLRSGENPAQWRGKLDHLLPARAKVKRVEHLAALPYSEMPEFMARLRERPSTAALALEFLILTAARSGEVLGARWSEIDMAGKIWTVPGARMKAGKDHRIPLCGAAVAILETMATLRAGEFVFPGQCAGSPCSTGAFNMLLHRMGITATTHGFRSSFRDWCGETTTFPREIAEQALAHSTGDAVEQAYRRGDALAKRRKLMEAWGTFCARPAAKGEVVSLLGVRHDNASR